MVPKEAKSSSYIGSGVEGKVFRNDAFAKVTGKAKYTDDYKFQAMAHAVPVYADYVYAENLKVESSKAESLPGVLRVITASDIPGSIYFGQIEQDLAMLAQDKIMYQGDVAALVVAETREAALAGAELVVVKADQLTPLLDPEEAMDAPSIRPGKNSNIVNHHIVRRGNAAEAIKNSDIVIQETFGNTFVEHGYMEPECGIAVPRPDGVMEIYGSMQHPFSTRRFAAAILGEPLSNVEIIATSMGGGFGGKDDTAAVICARAALAARLINRPVKITYDREWSIRESYKRHPYKIYYTMGLTKEGLIQGVETKMIANSGAYVSVTPWVTWRSTVQCCGPYCADHVQADVYGVATNMVFTGAMRGFGSPQVNFAIEQLMDIAAEKTGLSPLEIRRKNMVKQGKETITGQVLDDHIVSMEEVMDKVAEAIDYEKKLKTCSKGKSVGNELYGIGLSISYRGASLGAEGQDFCSCVINGQFDGSILLETAIHENGQGAESVMMLMLAEQLGVDLKHIRYRRASTSNIPDGGTTVATRGTIMGGGAVTIAAKQLKELIADTLAPELGCKPKEVFFKDDHIQGPNKKISWHKGMQLMYDRRVYPYAFGTFQAPDVSWDEEKGRGRAYFTWVYSSQAVELTVNKKTGKIKLLNIVAAHDVGKAVNRAMVLGQMYGGITQGTGMALSEDIGMVDGKITNLNFNKYKMMKASDMPEITGIIVENRDPLSPSGSKGIGEPALELIAPAIANAVYHATGIRFKSMPITIDPEVLT